MNKTRIYAQDGRKLSEDDRNAMALLLIKQGYTARTDREKQGNKSTWVWFVEYWGNEL